MTGIQIKKGEGPRCACGKVDLYDEWIKNNPKNKIEGSKDDEKSDNQVNTSGISDNEGEKLE